MSNKILVFTATYCEKEGIRNFYDAVKKVSESFDLLVIDDNSPDGTASILEGLASTDPTLKLIVRSGKLGLGSAHVMAMEYAIENNYDLLVTLDSDLSHDPADIPRLIKELGKF